MRIKFALPALTLELALKKLELTPKDLEGKNKEQQHRAIKKAFRKQSLKHHPDIAGKEKEEEFKLINACNHFLVQMINSKKGISFGSERSSVSRRGREDFDPWWKEDRGEKSTRVKGPGLWREERVVEADFEQIVREILIENRRREKDVGEKELKTSHFLDFSSQIGRYQFDERNPFGLIEHLGEKIPRSIIDGACLEDLEEELKKKEKEGIRVLKSCVNQVKQLVIENLFQFFI